MKNYIRLSIHPVSEEQSEILIALLSELGFEGFEEEENTLHAFVEEEQFNAAEVNELLGRFNLNFSTKIIPPTNWNDEWEKNFHPVVVDDFCAVRASFHNPVRGVKHEIIITPKMSFGTGHHASTYMMIQGMKAIDFTGKKVLDFGTGTGILAILAEKCGAATVLAIDNDDHCIQNASENTVVNQCHAVLIEKADSAGAKGLYDVILANINKNTIVANLASFQQHLTPDSVLLLSGLLQEDLEDIRQEAAKNKLVISAMWEKQNWICLQLTKMGKMQAE
jgi:ribosomal protein L11 methyltransferase